MNDNWPETRRVLRKMQRENTAQIVASIWIAFALGVIATIFVSPWCVVIPATILAFVVFGL